MQACDRFGEATAVNAKHVELPEIWESAKEGNKVVIGEAIGLGQLTYDASGASDNGTLILRLPLVNKPAQTEG